MCPGFLVKVVGDVGRLSCSQPYWNRLEASGKGAAGCTKALPIISASAATGGAMTRKNPGKARHGTVVRYAAAMRFPGQGVADDGQGSVSAISADV
jgi:hypothetical protein